VDAAGLGDGDALAFYRGAFTAMAEP
jgi:hypothetical protein